MRSSTLDRSCTDRIIKYLSQQAEGVSSTEIATEVLRLSNTGRLMADRLVAGILKNDPRAERTSDGLWRAATRDTPPRPEETVFLVAVLREGRDRVGKKVPAGVATVEVIGNKTEPPREYVLTDRDSEDLKSAAEQLIDHLASKVLVTFDKNRTGRSLREFLEPFGDLVNAEVLSLQRLGKRFLGLTHHPTFPELCEKVGLETTYEGDPVAEASLLAEVFLRLREKGRERDAGDKESLFEAQAFRPKEIDYSRYAFDERFLRDLPRRPGVYSMYDREGKIIYVGKTKDLRSRVSSYFKSGEDTPKKITRLLESLYYIQYTEAGSGLEAELIEARMIREEHPEVNVQEQVHPRESAVKVKPNLVLVLPSVDPDSAELFLLSERFPLEIFRLRKDFENGEEAEALFEETYFGESGEDLVDPDAEADIQLVRSYAARRRDKIPMVDVGAAAGASDLLEKVKEEVRDLEQ